MWYIRQEVWGKKRVLQAYWWTGRAWGLWSHTWACVSALLFLAFWLWANCSTSLCLVFLFVKYKELWTSHRVLRKVDWDHSFIQQVCFGLLLCVRECSRYGRENGRARQTNPCPTRASIPLDLAGQQTNKCINKNTWCNSAEISTRKIKDMMMVEGNRTAACRLGKVLLGSEWRGAVLAGRS